MWWSDSDEEPLELEPKQPKERKHRFKRFAERINEIDIDVFRSTEVVRAEPLFGHACFFHEHLVKWRELNLAQHFADMWSDLFQKCQSLPLLLHYREEIFDTLVRHLTVQAELSLPPITALLAILARDLQADYLPFIPRLFAATAELLESGGDRSPETIEHCFSSLAQVIRHLQKFLLADLPSLLDASRRLRFSKQDYIRSFAAEAIGFLLRTADAAAGGHALKSAVRYLLTECVQRPSHGRIDGTSALFAEAMMGSSQGLHSRAPQLLQLLLKEDLVRPAAPEPELKQETVRLRVLAVTTATLRRLLAHTMRGRGQPLWECLTQEAMRRLAVTTEPRAAMRVLCLIAMAVEFEQGTHIEDIAAVMEVASAALKHAAFSAARDHEEEESEVDDASDELEALRNLTFGNQACRLVAAILERRSLAEAAATAANRDEPQEEAEEGGGFKMQQYNGPSLAESKEQEAAARSLLERMAPTWALAFSTPPPHEVLVLLERLLGRATVVRDEHDKRASRTSAVAARDVLRLFGPHMLAALHRALADTLVESERRALPMLSDLCGMLQPALRDALRAEMRVEVDVVSLQGSTPVLMMCRHAPTALVKFVQQRIDQVATRCMQTVEQVTAHDLHVLWSCLGLLPFGVQDWKVVARAASQASQATSQLLALRQDLSGACLVVLGEAMRLEALAQRMAGGVMEELLVVAERHVALACAHPDVYHILEGAACSVETVRAAWTKLTASKKKKTKEAAVTTVTPLPALLSDAKLLELLPLFAHRLASDARPMRRMILRLLSAFEQPLNPNAPAPVKSNDAATAVTAENRSVHAAYGAHSTLLQDLFFIESATSTLDNGRRASALLMNIKVALEYSKLPPTLLLPTVYSLLGVLSIKFAVVWPSAIEALGAALEFHHAVAWPVIFAHLERIQGAFLSQTKETTGELGGVLATSSSALLEARFEAAQLAGQVAAGGGCTDVATRLQSLLKAMAKAPAGPFESSASRTWMPLVLTYLSPVLKDDTAESLLEDEDGIDAQEHAHKGAGWTKRKRPRPSSLQQSALPVRTRDWRTQLRAWLDFLSGVGGLKSLVGADQLRAALARLLLDADSGIQQAVIKCLRPFKFKFLTPYTETLLKLCDNKSLRHVMTTWSIYPEAEEGINVDHRAGLVPLLIRVLYPKMRKRTGRLGGRGAAGSARAAILNYLATLHEMELVPLFELMLTPLAHVLLVSDDANRVLDAESQRMLSAYEAAAVVPPPSWSMLLPRASGKAWLHGIDMHALATLAHRRRIGFLNAVEDLLSHLGVKLIPYLPALLAMTMRLLQLGCHPLALAAESSKEAALTVVGTPRSLPSIPTDQARELRSVTLHLFTKMLERYPDAQLYAPFWDVFFDCTTVLAPRLQVECNAAKAPPLLLCVSAIVSEPALAVMLSPNWKSAEKDGRGPALLGFSLGILATEVASADARDVALSLVEELVEHGDETLLARVLDAHVPSLLTYMRTAMDLGMGTLDVAQKGQSGSGQLTALAVAKARRHAGSMQHSWHVRQLSVLESLTPRVASPSLAEAISTALLPLLRIPAGRRHGAATSNNAAASGRRMEQVMQRALGALAGVWNAQGAALRLHVVSTHGSDEALWEFVSTLAPLFAFISTRDARLALSRAMEALAVVLSGKEAFDEPLESLASSPSLVFVTRLLSEMSSFSTDAIDEMDYTRRLEACRFLTKECWLCCDVRLASPLLHATLFDLRNDSDLALRHAAAAAMNNFVEAMQQVATTQEAHPLSRQDAAYLVHRLVLPAIKAALMHSASAVRQEYLSLLRQLVLTLGPLPILPPPTPPTLSLTHQLFAELVPLCSVSDPEKDFFLNMASIQLHRRGRALQRVRKSLEDGSLRISSSSCVAILVPLLQQMIVGGRAGDTDIGRELKQRELDADANVAEHAADCLGAVAQLLPWSPYEQVLNRMLNMLQGKSLDATHVRLVVKAVCSVLNSFHFSSRDEAAAAAAAAMVREEEAREAARMIALQEVAPVEDEEEDEEQQEGGGARKKGASDGEEEEEEEEEEAEEGQEPAAKKSRVEQKDEAAVVEEEEEVVVEEEDDHLAADEPVRGDMRQAVLQSLVQRVLPALRRHLVVDEKQVRAPVAMALVKVLQLLPAELEKRELPKALQVVVNLLKSREQDARDEARKTLVQMVRDLGAGYLATTLTVLRASLPPRGIQAHVVGYTTHALLKGLSDAAPGSLDDAIPIVLGIIESDLLSQLAEEKQVGALRAKAKELRSVRAYDSYELLAKLVLFSERIDQVLDLVRVHLPQAHVPALRGKLHELLLAAGRGILSNSTATPQALLEFVYNLLDDSLATEEAARAAAEAEVGAAHSEHARRIQAGENPVVAAKIAAAAQAKAARQSGKNDARTLAEGAVPAALARGAQGNTMLLELALQVFHSTLKKGEIGATCRQPATLALLDPLLTPLVRALASRHSAAVSLALRSLCFLVPLPLPSLATSARQMSKGATTLLKRCTQTTHPMAQDCLKLIASLLRDCSTYQPTTAQIRFLLKWAFTDIEETESRGVAFSLLRAVIARKLMLPEVYDLMGGIVQEMMIRSQAPSVRDLCSSALLQFLLDYPLGEKRLEQHVTFLLTNAQEYEYESGRLTALEFIQTLLQKLPVAVLEARAAILLLPLVTRMTADTMPSCRTAAAKAIKILLMRVGSQHADTALEYVHQWLTSAHRALHPEEAGEGEVPPSRAAASRLLRAATQLAGVLAELQGAKFARRVPELLGPVLLVLARHVDAGWEDEQDDEEEVDGEQEGEEEEGEEKQQDLQRPNRVVQAGWQDIYCCLHLIEQLCQHCPAPLLAPGAETAAARLDDEETLSEEQTSAIVWETCVELLLYPHVWVRKSVARLLGHALAAPRAKQLLLTSDGVTESQRLGQLAMSIFLQLESTSADDDLAAQDIKLLVALSRDMASSEHAAASETLKTGDQEEDEDEEHDRTAMLSLHGLVRRMTRLADDKSYTRRLQRHSALKWIAAIALAWPAPHLAPYLAILCRPLHRILDPSIANQPGAPPVPEEIQALAETVSNTLRNSVGPELLMTAYNQAREYVKTVRVERKRKQALEAMLDPELRARKKMRQTERKTTGKRRKLDELKRARSVGRAVKNRRDGGGGRGRGRGGDRRR